MRSRALAALLTAGVLALGTAGCSGSDAAKEALGPKPDLPTAPTEPLWNPCSALDLDEVNELFSATFSQQTGSASEPTCTFTPSADGAVAIDINYSLYAGTLRDIVAELGDPESVGATLTAPRLPDANGARIISNVTDDTLAVTGFVRNGRLVQFVNALDPAPYDKAGTVRGVRELMVRLAKHADESGLSGS